jgi:leucyl aminopeptidase
MTNAIHLTEKTKSPSVALQAFTRTQYDAWQKKQPIFIKNWLAANHFKSEAGSLCLLPGKDGKLAAALAIIEDMPNIWSIAHLALRLPDHTYHLEGVFTPEQSTQMALGWALAGYEFTRYKKSSKEFATLVAPKGCDVHFIRSMAQSICWARDLINTPANDMNPAALAEEAASFGRRAKGKVTVIKGEDLLKQNWTTVYTVGKASSVPPHVVDIRFPRKGAPKVTLVGKGVCFDSGGLDIKPSSNMRLMKKDMAGVAIVLALAKTLLETDIPVDLRLILPIVENAVGGNAMRPLDIVTTRKGITVEIGNTDAEGRLILCDALFEADEEAPDLLVDFSTLTGAARVALGTELPAFFTPDSALADELIRAGVSVSDPMWQLPLWKQYRKHMDSPTADISNDSDTGYGGAITAALYLQEFVSKTPAWIHVDMMAWNLSDKPGRPKGGEAMALRAIYALIKERYGR